MGVRYLVLTPLKKSRKNKGFTNKDPKYIKKLRDEQKKLYNFFRKESKCKLGRNFKNGPQR